VTDTPAVLLTAAVLSAVAVSTFAWRVKSLDPSQPERLIGELRLAQWAAVLLAGVGAIPIGVAMAAGAATSGGADAALGVIFVGVAGLVLQRDPREGLLIVAGAFLAHALITLAHRPGWLPPDLVSGRLAASSATYDVWIAAICYWTRRG
jgi:hypothetical protein